MSGSAFRILVVQVLHASSLQSQWHTLPLWSTKVCVNVVFRTDALLRGCQRGRLLRGGAISTIGVVCVPFGFSFAEVPCWILHKLKLIDFRGDLTLIIATSARMTPNIEIISPLAKAPLWKPAFFGFCLRAWFLIMRERRKILCSRCGWCRTNQKIPTPIKIELAPSPPPPKTPTPPLLKRGTMWEWGLSSRKSQKMAGAHKIGAAISGPRITGWKIADLRLLLNKFREAKKWPWDRKISTLVLPAEGGHFWLKFLFQTSSSSSFF